MKAKSLVIQGTTIRMFKPIDFKQREYDKLAETIRANIDISQIYKIMNEG